MRSLLLVAAHDERALETALSAHADAIVFDLDVAVPDEDKDEARRNALAMLRHRQDDWPPLYVRISGLRSAYSEGDLDVVMTGAPEGIVLPATYGSADLMRLDSRLAVREALHGLHDGETRVIAAMAPSFVSGIANGGGLKPMRRLVGLSWTPLAPPAPATAGPSTNGAEGDEPARILRASCVLAAAAIDVPAIDCAEDEASGIASWRRSNEAALRDGFAAKFAVSPAQIEPINEAFARLADEGDAPTESPQEAAASSPEPRKKSRRRKRRVGLFAGVRRKRT